MESLVPPFDAYKGNAPYIFVSYAHKNSDIVFGHLTRLRNEGFRIWYDEGIDPGADWSDEIASSLVNAEVFLVFISEAAIASQNVRKEIVFALGHKKHMVCVHVDETDLPLGLKMQLGNIQALLESRFHDKEKFYDRLFNALLPEKTRGKECADLPITYVPRKSKAKSEPSAWARHKKAIFFSLLLTVSLAVAAVGGYALMRKFSHDIIFADKNLELALRSEMQRPRGVITETDLVLFKGNLDLSSRNISDISPLRHLRRIYMLNLDNNRIVDISPLSDIEELVVLSLSNNRISDLSPLHGLKHSLLALNLNGNPIKDLKQLRTLNNLSMLDLERVPITDLELGKHLRRLKNLTIHQDGHGLSSEDLYRFKYDLPSNCEVEMTGAGGRS